MAVILAAFVLICAAVLIFSVWWMETHLPPEKDAQVILILGAQVKEDGTPSIALERRMTAALNAYQEERRPVICCGAQGGNEPAPEGLVMQAWMIEHGCRPEDVIAETDSLNTRQNLQNAKRIMEKLGLHKALIVTSDYHVPRALALAGQTGLDAAGRGSPSKPQYFIRNHLREGASWLKFLWESYRRGDL